MTRLVRMRYVTAGVGVIALLLLLTACDNKPQQAAPSAQPPAKQQPAVKLTAAMRITAKEPAGVKTGLFIDRPPAAELRVVSYNINWDKIFPDVDEAQAEKFQRVIKALNPDILAIQEIGFWEADVPKTADDVAALMNAIDPLPGGRTWQTFKCRSNVVVSKYALSMTVPKLDPPSYRDPAIALVDLPDDKFAIDAYVLNNHFKSNSRPGSQEKRQQQADAIISWLRDARTAGGKVDLPKGTALLITGDLNLVEGPQPLTTVLAGNIVDEETFGQDSPPDWDGTPLVDAHPLHNGAGSDDYTWRDDSSEWKPSRLDFIIYSDSVLEAVHRFVLNTTTMTDEDLAKARLEKFDVTLDTKGSRFDHLPIVVDFRVVAP